MAVVATLYRRGVPTPAFQPVRAPLSRWGYEDDRNDQYQPPRTPVASKPSSSTPSTMAVWSASAS